MDVYLRLAAAQLVRSEANELFSPTILNKKTGIKHMLYTGLYAYTFSLRIFEGQFQAQSA